MAQTNRVAIANVPAGTTDNVIVAGIPGQGIKVTSFVAVCGGTATNFTFNSLGSSSTAISCLFANGANGGEVCPRNDDGWFITKSGESLTCTTGSGSTTGILVNYNLV